MDSFCMTREEARAKCIEVIEAAMEHTGHLPSRSVAGRAFDSLHGLAWIIPVEATNGSRPLRYGNVQNNDLTNAPEKKP